MAADCQPNNPTAFQSSSELTGSQGQKIRLVGLVQGVGFRPWVWRLAKRYGLVGQVCNDGKGLTIRVWGQTALLEAFVQDLLRHPPPLARIDGVETWPLSGRAPRDFQIVKSAQTNPKTFVMPDLALCSDCRLEIETVGQRRFRYPFTHCSQCGPRFSIIKTLPYERSHTSMGVFKLCQACLSEYRDPAGRCFHAEPTACPQCGPAIEGRFPTQPVTEDMVAAAAALLKQGKILALKGVGGFQLLADATDHSVVARLRQRKRRPHKPLALMARDRDVISRYCRLQPREIAALTSPAAPIVLLDVDGRDRLPENLAPGLGRLGFILPYTGLHQLLLDYFDTPLVFTSGNSSNQPLCAENHEALTNLEGIADFFVWHDRQIVHRCDDSVTQLAAGEIRLIRRARGFAPAPLPLPEGMQRCEGLVALGGELKSTFCLLSQGQAVLSQHLGDLENVAAFELYRSELQSFIELYGSQVTMLAIDGHPDYLSSKWGRSWARQEGLILCQVQHHHAHMAACLAEHGEPLAGEPILGLILDGLGYGGDGTFWGGELLVGRYRNYRRLARLKPVAMPGGTLALREPWRNLVAQLEAAGLGTESFKQLADQPVATIRKMIEHRLNAPLASSCGRLLDAVAAALGLCLPGQSYEGQAAAELERLACLATETGEPYPFALSWQEGLMTLDPAPMWQSLIQDVGCGLPAPAVASKFHLGLVRGWLAVIEYFANKHHYSKVVLSGGVFQNRLLLEALAGELTERGIQALIPRRVPANDGGLALGQAVVAAARLKSERG